jgi:thioredoxin 1
VATATAFSESRWEKEVLGAARPVAALFWADWCIPCRTVLPYFEAAAAGHEGHVRLGTVNVDENQRLARRYAVVGLPTLLVFRDGQEVVRRVGLVSEEKLAEILADLANA